MKRPRSSRSNNRLTTRPANRRATPLGHVLSQVSQDLGLDRRVQELAVLALWGRVVPPAYSQATRATRIVARPEGLRLQVTAADAAVAGALGFQLAPLVAALNAYSPQTGITLSGIDLRIGSL